ncbi:MAG: hypothetical protein H8E32_04825 [Nitrospinae bacterium]|nr:hypothetical protein [Nitrospinota bacterium]
MPKVKILCQASFNHGMGHLIRQIHIAKELQKHDIKISFCIPEFSAAATILKENNFSYSMVDKFDSSSQIKIDKTDWVMLDIQDTTLSLIQSLRKRSEKIISFEDQGEGRNHVDILIDCNLNISDAKNITSKTKTLFDLDYSVLAPEFEKFHLEKRKFPDQIQSLLITFGGTDPHNITLELAKQIPNHFKTTLIAGPGFQNLKELRELKKSHFSIQENIQNMASVLASHDAVFCSGGVTLHEAMCVGTPAFVISQVAHQEVKAKAAEKTGAAINLGQASSWSTNRLDEIFKIDEQTLQGMSVAGKQCIDGKGLKRVVEAILSIC